MVFAETARWARPYRRLRRAFDVVSSLIGMALSLPLMILTAAAIRIESPGAVFYTQERVGLHGRKFRIFKSRSMQDDAEADGLGSLAIERPARDRVGRIIRSLAYRRDPGSFSTSCAAR